MADTLGVVVGRHDAKGSSVWNARCGVSKMCKSFDKDHGSRVCRCGANGRTDLVDLVKSSQNSKTFPMCAALKDIVMRRIVKH
jgi:hypothetical protein